MKKIKDLNQQCALHIKEHNFFQLMQRKNNSSSIDGVEVSTIFSQVFTKVLFTSQPQPATTHMPG
jgi:hypothetical protein